jgi:hypothetical protein
VNVLEVAMEDRLANWRDLGARLHSAWDGQFLNVVRACDGSLVKFVQSLGQFRAFDDPLHKLSMLVAIMHTGAGLAHFDTRPLPAVDYHIVKQLLRLRVVIPDQALEFRLASRKVLSTDEGTQLRSAALRALVELSELSGVSGDRIDNLLWLNRANCCDDDPVCNHAAIAERCPFLACCKRHVRLARPLENTRYY